MSTWRRKALALFPELAKELPAGQDARHEFFWHLSLQAADAHKAIDEAALRRIHGFAEWSLHQSVELWRNAAIGFYEDLFATVPWKEIVPWLSPFVIEQIKRTWALGIQAEKGGEFDELVRARRDPAYQRHAFATGEIDRL